MRRHACVWLLVSVWLGGSLFAGTRAWAQPPPKSSALPASSSAASDEKKADELFLKGKTLYANGKLEEAYQAYKAAFESKKRYDIAGNLGNVAHELGKMRDAAEYLAYCIANFPANAPAEKRAALAGLLGDARKSVGT